MGPAKFFSALVGLGVILAAGAQSLGLENCPPCSKILMPVCGVDDEQETKTFPSSCVLRWCNCMLQAADSDRSFKEVNSGHCEGYPSNEAEIPECFPEMETTDESTDDGPTYRTMNFTEVAPTVETGHTFRTTNVTKAAPATGVGPTPRTLNVTEAPVAAGACHVPGAVLAVAAVAAALVASGDL